MTRIFLLRHGATAANRETPYRLQGRGSARPLDEVGLLQAQAAGRALSGFTISAVYASPLLRAMQTGDLIASPHGRHHAAVPALIEGDVGRWEGLTWREASVQDPEIHDRFMNEPGTVPYPE